MPNVNAHHPKFRVMTEKYRKIRVAIAGEDEVKAAGPEYLPVPEGMTRANYMNTGTRASSEYHEYVTRASFLDASGRTVVALTGAVMRKTPNVEYPDQDRLKNITPKGESIEQLLRSAIREDVSVGRLGFLVDAPEMPGALAEGVSDSRVEPFVALYKAESIINWTTAPVDGRKQPVMVVLKEDVEVTDPEDPFEKAMQDRWRVLWLGIPSFAPLSLEEAQFFGVENPENTQDPNYPSVEQLLEYYGLTVGDFSQQVYWQEIWREKPQQAEGTMPPKKTDQPEYELVRRIFPRKNGGMLWNEITFEFVNPTDREADPSPPPLLPLVNTNLSHFRNSADNEWGMHFTALPTAWAAGFDLPTGTELKVGSAVAWVTDNADARAGYLEFTGQGLAAIREEMQRKEKHMAALGSRLLEQPPKGSEAFETVRLRQAGEQSVLAAVAGTVSNAATQALKWVREWESPGASTDSVLVELNEDFNLIGLDPKMLESLMLGVQNGTVSWRVFFFNMQRGEMYPDNHTLEQEARLISAGSPDNPEADQDEEDVTAPTEEEVASA